MDVLCASGALAWRPGEDRCVGVTSRPGKVPSAAGRGGLWLPPAAICRRTGGNSFQRWGSLRIACQRRFQRQSGHALQLIKIVCGGASPPTEPGEIPALVIIAYCVVAAADKRTVTRLILRTFGFFLFWSSSSVVSLATCCLAASLAVPAALWLVLVAVAEVPRVDWPDPPLTETF